MLSRRLHTVAVTLILVAPSACFAAGPRVHRGPTSPKLFKDRTARQPLAPKTASHTVPAASDSRAAETHLVAQDRPEAAPAEEMAVQSAGLPTASDQ